LLFGFISRPSARGSFQCDGSPDGPVDSTTNRGGFPFDSVPSYLVRDNDGIYGEVFQRRVQQLGIEDVPITPRSPWQNPYVERLIGTIRRECLNHVIVLNESHLKRILGDYLDYYHVSRPHQALDDNAPLPREVEPPERGRVVAQPMVGGLHHRYFRRAA
jgi:putative transposase